MYGTNYNLNMEPEEAKLQQTHVRIHGVGVQPECPKDQLESREIIEPFFHLV